MRAAIIFLALIALSAADDFYLCNVVVPNFCAIGTERDCLSDPTLTLQGEQYDITTGFNVISFGDFDTNSADTEGRVLASGNANMGAGYSIGAEVYTKGPGATDTQYPYSAIFGGNVNWPSGRLLPDGTDQFAAAYAEYMYVGGTFSGSSDLELRVSSNTESISADMTNAQSFYTQLQAALDAVTDNMSYAVQYGTCTFTCDDVTDSSYSVHMSTADLGSCTSYAFVSCASDVQMVITITDDNSDVDITSGAINPSDRDASRTVFNILGSGRTIEFSSVRFYGIILAPNNIYTVDTNAPGATDGIVIVASVLSSGQFNRVNCSTPIVPAQPQPCVSFEAVCAGSTFVVPGSDITGDTRDYNVISFGNFIANTGDIEGRLMVEGNAVFGDGYSIGYMLQTANNLVDRQEAYGLLAGGSCTWGSGALYPDGSNAPFAGPEEGIYCGESFTGPADLSARNAGPCAVEGCLDSIFEDAYTCYTGYSATATVSTSNVVATVSFDALILTCSDSTATSYVVNIDSSLFTQFTYYATSNCGYQSEWTINVVGSGDVYFSGDSFPAPNGAVVYNIAGERTIYVDNTAVNGHILAPDATLNQTGGVILGKVVVGDVIASLQINKEDTCVTLTTTNVPITTGNTTVCEGCTTICPSPPNMPISLYAPINSQYYGESSTVTGETDDGCVGTSSGPITEIAANTKVGTIAVPSNAGGNAPAVAASSSASAVVLSFAVLAVALLF